MQTCWPPSTAWLRATCRSMQARATAPLAMVPHTEAGQLTLLTVRRAQDARQMQVRMPYAMCAGEPERLKCV